MDFPKGFCGGATAAGLKPSDKLDMGVLVSETPCVGAGVFTRNLFQGANIPFCREALAKGAVRAIVVHAGQANACTGAKGIAAAQSVIDRAAKHLGCESSEIVLGSTGVIGVLPDTKKIFGGFEKIFAADLTPEGIQQVGKAMMTTDTVQKTASVKFKLGGKTVTILGLAKGAGMIHPNMGTMLSYIVTDAAIARPALQRAVKESADATYNCLTVDGDTSTSDMVVVLANGAAENKTVKGKDSDYLLFQKKLKSVCESLARQIATDGEGATRLVTVRVKKAASQADAHRAAMAVASSNLVKCAIFGRDPNWGRIAAALGYSGAKFDPSNVTIMLGGVKIFTRGTALDHDRLALSLYLSETKEVVIDAVLNAGTESCSVWTCDFSHEYVTINAHYTT